MCMFLCVIVSNFAFTICPRVRFFSFCLFFFFLGLCMCMFLSVILCVYVSFYHLSEGSVCSFFLGFF